MERWTGDVIDGTEDCHQRTLTAVSAAENRLSVYSVYNVYKSVYNYACSKTIEPTAPYL